MNKLLFIILLLFPAFVFATTQGATYENEAGTSQMIADSFGEIYSFFYDDVPSLFDRMMDYLLYWSIQAKLYLQLEALKSSWRVAKLLLQDFNIMSQIIAQANLLPVDVRQALIDMKLFDGLNVLVQAYVTRFVLDLTGR